MRLRLPDNYRGHYTNTHVVLHANSSRMVREKNLTMGFSRRRRLMQGEIRGLIEAKWLQVLMKVSLGNALAETGGPRLANEHTIPRLRLVTETVVITE
jgi:hypothetical protein